MKNMEEIAFLGGLHVKDELKNKIEKSLDEVVKLLKEVEGFQSEKVEQKEYTATSWVNVDETLYSRGEEVSGVHLEESIFLAPKAIKK